jgi:hypothetical protein
LNELVLMTHVLFGVGCIVTAVWLFVDVLHAHDVRRLTVGGRCSSLRGKF